MYEGVILCNYINLAKSQIEVWVAELSFTQDSQVFATILKRNFAKCLKAVCYQT